MDISMFCDRHQPKVAKCQTGFINFIVSPIFDLWGQYIPQLREMCMPPVQANLPDEAQVQVVLLFSGGERGLRGAGIADGKVLCDGEVVFEASDIRVGLFTPEGD
mgnify:CR=1 FL=1